MRHGDRKDEFDTGATRDTDDGKGRPSLITATLIHRTAVHLAKGEKHYGKNNWTKGMPFCRTADSLIRHIFQWLDQDEVEDHLAAIVCNAMFLMYYESECRELDDRGEKRIPTPALTFNELNAKINEEGMTRG